MADVTGSDHHTGPLVREVCGALHLHTEFSDGSVSFGVLAQTARDLGLDFVGVNDHMTLDGRAAGEGGLRDGVFVMIGYEHDDRHGINHYLVYGTDCVADARDHPQHYIDAVREAGGIGFIAHPFEHRRYFRRLPPYPWTDWSVQGFDGVEVWNQMSDWAERIRSWLSVVRFAYPRRFLVGAPPELLRKWDELNRQRFVAGIGGVDAHTRQLRLGPFRYTVFRLRVELKGIRTHLYLPSPGSPPEEELTEQKLMGAMREGRGFVSNYRWGDARGTRVYLRTAQGAFHLPGRSERPMPPDGVIHVLLPSDATVSLVRNGTVEGRFTGRQAAFRVREPGVYRVEARKRGRPWIYANPFPVGTYPL